MTSNNEEVVLTIEDSVGIVKIQRPPVNALTIGVARAIERHVMQCVRDPEVGAIVLTGGRDHFSGGADIKVLLDTNTGTPESVAGVAEEKDEIYTRVADCPLPIVAAIDGYALGGGLMLTLYCDMRVAGREASLGLPEVRLGSVPGFGMDRLVELLGRSRAMYLAATGIRITGEHAFDIGLVDEVCDSGEATERALALARILAENSRETVRLAKRTINAVAGLPFANGRQMGFMVADRIAHDPKRNAYLKSFVERRSDTRLH